MLPTKRFAVKASSALTFVSVLLFFRAYSPIQFRNKNATESTTVPAASVEAASNGTLGFPKVYLINIPSRFDYLDAATIQAFLSGVQFEVFLAVETNMIKEKGMPPTHDRERLREAEKGCWRAHANIWSQMLREELPSVLILEADVAWDTNVRAIIANFYEHFTLLLQQLNSTQLPRVKRAQKTEDEPTPNVFPDPHDPWHSKHWDILSLGHCWDHPLHHENMLKYNDEHVPAGKEYYGDILGNERVVRKSGGIACTTAYAISQTGAAKLLLRTAMDLDLPVDLAIKTMIMSGDLVAYSVQPPIMSQWKYKPGIGMNLRGSNSDVQVSRQEEDDESSDAWEAVRQTRSVWMPAEDFPDVAFEEMALEGAWERILGGATPFMR
ncbi:glycosyl transferase family 25 protein [Colletotrichum incanum]|uniref:Glycosyl transferase family 25 protein n=1 Tax=Colletotrichum incanum TaxID=1573173 RepID=A0A166SEZ9_COLIC|nr:glycosyl transferase family 25 protein [Colletotrichum incanum]